MVISELPIESACSCMLGRSPEIALLGGVCLSNCLGQQGTTLHGSNEAAHSNGYSCRWLVSPPAPHQRSENGLQADQWSYNTSVPAGAIYNVHVTLLQVCEAESSLL